MACSKFIPFFACSLFIIYIFEMTRFTIIEVTLGISKWMPSSSIAIDLIAGMRCWKIIWILKKSTDWVKQSSFMMIFFIHFKATAGSSYSLFLLFIFEELSWSSGQATGFESHPAMMSSGKTSIYHLMLERWLLWQLGCDRSNHF